MTESKEDWLDNINQVLMCYEKHVYQELGHRYPVVEQKSIDRKQVIQVVQAEISKAEKRGELHIMERILDMSPDLTIDLYWFQDTIERLQSELKAMEEGRAN